MVSDKSVLTSLVYYSVLGIMPSVSMNKFFCLFSKMLEKVQMFLLMLGYCFALHLALGYIESIMTSLAFGLCSIYIALVDSLKGA